jgi:hypothetical protein
MEHYRPHGFSWGKASFRLCETPGQARAATLCHTGSVSDPYLPEGASGPVPVGSTTNPIDTRKTQAEPGRADAPLVVTTYPERRWRMFPPDQHAASSAAVLVRASA